MTEKYKTEIYIFLCRDILAKISTHIILLYSLINNQLIENSITILNRIPTQRVGGEPVCWSGGFQRLDSQYFTLLCFTQLTLELWTFYS